MEQETGHLVLSVLYHQGLPYTHTHTRQSVLTCACTCLCLCVCIGHEGVHGTLDRSEPVLPRPPSISAATHTDVWDTLVSF